MLHAATNTGEIEATDQVRLAFRAFGAPLKAPFTSSIKGQCNASSCRQLETRRSGGLPCGRRLGFASADNKVNLFKVVTVKDEIVIGLSDEEMKALGGSDASAVAHTLAQKGRHDGVAI
jgi:hypothetical protein